MDNPEEHAQDWEQYPKRRQKNQKHNTENYKFEQHWPHQKTGDEAICSLSVSSPYTYDTRRLHSEGKGRR